MFFTISFCCNSVFFFYNFFFFLFFNDTATTEIYTLSLHDALPVSFVQIVRPTAIMDDEPVRMMAAQSRTDALAGMLGRGMPPRAEAQPAQRTCADPERRTERGKRADHSPAAASAM